MSTRVLPALLIGLVLLIIGFFVVRPTHPEDEEVGSTDQALVTESDSLPAGCPYDEENYRLVEKGSEYRNDIRGYSLTLPRGYFLPTDESSENESDPHFYNCTEGIGFELQDGNASFENLTEQQVNEPKVTTSSFPGAVVTGGKSEGASLWSYWYTIIYLEDKRGFTLAANRPIEEYEFLSTFRIF